MVRFIYNIQGGCGFAGPVLGALYLIFVYHLSFRKNFLAMAGAVSVEMPKGGFLFDLCKR